MAVAKSLWADDALLRLPDDGRKYELVNGELQEVPATVRHDEVGAIVIYRLTPFIIGRGVLCSAQAGFRMRNGNLRSPDVSFIRRERLPNGVAPDTFGEGAPDLCIEIISSSEERIEIERKVREYFEAGAEQVWHLFPETSRVTVFTSHTDFQTFEATDEIDGGTLLPGFRLLVSGLFNLP